MPRCTCQTRRGSPSGEQIAVSVIWYRRAGGSQVRCRRVNHSCNQKNPFQRIAFLQRHLRIQQIIFARLCVEQVVLKAELWFSVSITTFQLLWSNRTSCRSGPSWSLISLQNARAKLWAHHRVGVTQSLGSKFLYFTILRKLHLLVSVKHWVLW